MLLFCDEVMSIIQDSTHAVLQYCNNVVTFMYIHVKICYFFLEG